MWLAVPTWAEWWLPSQRGLPSLRTIFAIPETPNGRPDGPPQLLAEIVRVGENRRVSWRATPRWRMPPPRVETASDVAGRHRYDRFVKPRCVGVVRRSRSS